MEGSDYYNETIIETILYYNTVKSIKRELNWICLKPFLLFSIKYAN